MHIMYPSGIDRAKKATSIRLPPMEQPKPTGNQKQDAAMYMKISENRKMFGHTSKPGEILGIKRTNKLKRQLLARQRRQQSEADEMRQGLSSGGSERSAASAEDSS